MEIEEEWETKIEEWEQKIMKAFFEYAQDNELSAFNTSYYFAKQILPDESLLLKQCIIMDLIKSGIMQIIDEKWIIKE
jgi:predicted metal-binding protein